PLSVPTTKLPWTASPLFELGYRLPDGLGVVAANYRFLVAEGTETRTIDGAAFSLRTRIDINQFDLDIGGGPYSPQPRWNLSWRFGARIADVFYDSRASNAALLQQGSNDFVGAGPHARLDVERQIGLLPGLSLFGRIDGAVIVGQINQHFQEQVTDGPG